MAGPKRRQPTILIKGDTFTQYDMDGFTLEKWTQVYTDFATIHNLPLNEIQIDVSTADYDDKIIMHLYGYREMTKEEIAADKQAVVDAKNAQREQMRAHIAQLAEQYPELMPFQIQELP